MGVSLAVGDVIEDFELLDETGTPRRLSEFLAKGPVVLFFYPAAMTSGCTAESCHFRDLAADFAAEGRPGSGSAATRSTGRRGSPRPTSWVIPCSPTLTAPSPDVSAPAAPSRWAPSSPAG